jgi:AcrR family transcriptional regulator
MILMEKKPYVNISISEITSKAGVNRSTYYRNFNSKEDVIKFYFNTKIVLSFSLNVMDRDTPAKNRLMKFFQHYHKYKKELVLIYKNGLSHHILDALNELAAIHTDDERYQMYWYTGAVYNSLMFWVSNDMNKSPKTMSEIYASLMPDCFEDPINL